MKNQKTKKQTSFQIILSHEFSFKKWFKTGHFQFFFTLHLTPNHIRTKNNIDNKTIFFQIYETWNISY